MVVKEPRRSRRKEAVGRRSSLVRLLTSTATGFPVRNLIGSLLPVLWMFTIATPLISDRAGAANATANRALLVEAILSDDVARQSELIKQLADASDVLVEQSLIAWRGGSLYIFETNDTRIPFLLDPATDGEGR